MRWREGITPVPMSRVAIVAPQRTLRELLVRVADAGVVEFEPRPTGRSARCGQPRAAAGAGGVAPACGLAPDLRRIERSGRADLLAGEAQLGRPAARCPRGPEPPWPAGCPPTSSPPSPSGSRRSAVPWYRCRPARRAAADPAAPRGGRAFAPLVDTYATVPYPDIDPTPFAGRPTW